MFSTLEEQELGIRLLSFIGIFAVMALAELVVPRRPLTQPKHLRWLNNISLSVLNTAVLRVAFPTAAAGFASIVASNGWGLLNNISLPLWPAVLLSIVLLDLAIWYQHKVFHQVPWLWRLHAVHHVDRDLDVTSGARFHTLEIVLSMIIKFALIALLGAPVAAVILFEIILSGMAMFNHSNVKLPHRLDRVLRTLVVTPDMHRIHHSIHRNETDSNYGFNLSIWDRLFNTYIEKPEDGQQQMTIGVPGFNRVKNTVWLPGLLLLPFKWQQQSSARPETAAKPDRDTPTKVNSETEQEKNPGDL